MKYFLTALLFISVFTSGCKKENEAPLISITPAELKISGLPGDVKDFNISVSSEVKLSRLLIYIQPENQYEFVHKDTLLYTKNFTYKLQYQIPQAYAGKTLYFTFKAIDEDGDESVALKQIVVGDELLTEFTGLSFYSRSNLSNNAFDLENLVQSTSINDSSVRDIQEYTTDTTSQNLSYRWFSPAGGQFVKANNYDYGNATLLTAKNIFDGSVKLDVTDSIVVGDIYITKVIATPENRYFVIKITNVQDDAGNNQDKYTFNVKK